MKEKYTLFNPNPTGHGRNQPIYECHVTTAARNRVKSVSYRKGLHIGELGILLSRFTDL